MANILKKVKKQAVKAGKKMKAGAKAIAADFKEQQAAAKTLSHPAEHTVEELYKATQVRGSLANPAVLKDVIVTCDIQKIALYLEVVTDPSASDLGEAMMAAYGLSDGAMGLTVLYSLFSRYSAEVAKYAQDPEAYNVVFTSLSACPLALLNFYGFCLRSGIQLALTPVECFCAQREPVPVLLPAFVPPQPVEEPEAIQAPIATPIMEAPAPVMQVPAVVPVVTPVVATPVVATPVQPCQQAPCPC